MKTINVVAAVIKSENKVFATQRGYGDYKDRWEFPGGKVEVGESPEQAIVREIQEELQTYISIDGFMLTVEYDYVEFHLSMDCFLCSIVKGDLTLLEAEDSAWLSKKEIYSVDWLPADLEIVRYIEKAGII